MTWLTRVASVAALANGLALATAQLWPPAAGGAGRIAILVLGLGLVTWVNLIGVAAGARLAVTLTIAKLLPLLFFAAAGAVHVDVAALVLHGQLKWQKLGEAALLLLFAYSGFENTPAAAGEYRNPQRDLPFALLVMITVVTLIYVAVQAVALGTLPELASSNSPLAEAAGRFAGPAAVFLLTAGAVVSILGNIGNTTLLGPRYLFALARDGYGPALFAHVHQRWRTPAAAIAVQSAIALGLALSGSFVQLALLSVIARLATYIATAAALPILQRRFVGKPGALVLPGGPLIPMSALAVSLILFAAASWKNLMAAAGALLAGAVIYRFRRRD